MMDMRESKGRGLKDGPRRMSGRDPTPARRIPWPQIFKHHISLIEGHMKMLDMVQRHTVPDSDDHRTTSQFLARAKEMLYASKETERSMVLSADQIEQVPLRASSASMYPGCPTEDHEYGKIIGEYGRAAVNTQARGEEFIPAGVDHEVGQGKSVKRRKLSHSKATTAARENVSGYSLGSGSDSAAMKGANEPAVINGQAGHGRPAEGIAEKRNPHFFVDTEPSPVNLSGVPYRPLKRSSSPPEPTNANKTKRHKMKHDGDLHENTENDYVELEDISAEVDARMKEKEERRKKERKRKRNTKGSSALVNDEERAAVGADKPKKKRSRTSSGDAPLDLMIPKKRWGEDGEDIAGAEGKAKKKRKKSRGDATDN